MGTSQGSYKQIRISEWEVKTGSDRTESVFPNERVYRTISTPCESWVHVDR